MNASTPRALVVDDEKNVRLTLQQALEDLGLAVDTAEEGTSALEQTKTTDYDLVLLDHRMPGPDGLEVLRHIRQRTPDVPVVLVTAHGTVDRAVKAMRLGAIDVLLKPITTDTLRSLVDQVLRSPSIEEDTDAYEEWVQLATWHMRYRRTEAARSCLHEAIERDEERPEAHTLLGLLEANAENQDLAREHLQVAVDREAGDSTARVFLDHLTESGHLPALHRIPLLGFRQEHDDESEELTVGSGAESDIETGSPHRMLAVLEDEMTQMVPPAARQLIRFSSLSGRAHGKAELLLLTVIETPRQLSLSQAREAHKDKISALKDRLSDLAEDIGNEDLAVRPLVIVGHTTFSVIENVVAEESVQHLISRWYPADEGAKPSVGREIIDEIDCEVTFLRTGGFERASHPRVAAFIGNSPHAPFVARRALEWAQGRGVASLTLVNVQEQANDRTQEDLHHQGHRLLWDVADRAGLEEGQYERRVEIGKDVENTLAACASNYDFVCIGASRSTSLAKSLFGSAARRLIESTDCPLAIARGPKASHRSFLRDLGRRFAGG